MQRKGLVARGTWTFRDQKDAAQSKVLVLQDLRVLKDLMDAVLRDILAVRDQRHAGQRKSLEATDA